MVRFRALHFVRFPICCGRRTGCFSRHNNAYHSACRWLFRVGFHLSGALRHGVIRVRRDCLAFIGFEVTLYSVVLSWEPWANARHASACEFICCCRHRCYKLAFLWLIFLWSSWSGGVRPCARRIILFFVVLFGHLRLQTGNLSYGVPYLLS